MKIAFITAGAGKSYCGSCLQDILLIQGLIDAGHELKVIDMYTPISVDIDATLPVDKVHYSGINTYLRQKYEYFRKAHPALESFFEKPSVVNFALGFGVEVTPAALGEMTLSVLSGREGRQAIDLLGVMDDLESAGPYDVAVLSNSMLSALAPEIKKKFNIPVVCRLMGEEAFISVLEEGIKKKVMEVLRKNIGSVDVFIASSREYSKAVSGFLNISPDRIKVTAPSVPSQLYADIAPEPKGFTIGFLSKISPQKGLDRLVSALAILTEKYGADARILAGGEILDWASREYFSGIQRKVKEHRLGGRFRYIGRLDLEGKKKLFASSSVFSVPSAFPESRGIVQLEALSSGVPLVLPAHGAYVDIINNTGGGLLYEPGSDEDLAIRIKELYEQPELLKKLAASGREAVKEKYSLKRMVDENVKAFLSGKISN